MSFEDIIVLRYAKQTASPPWMNGITYAEIDTVATMTKGNTDIIITGDGSRNKTQVMPGGVSVSKEVKLSDNWNQLVMSVNYPSIDNYVLGVQDHTITPPASVPSALTNGTYRILDPASGASNLTRAGRVYYDADSVTLYYYGLISLVMQQSPLLSWTGLFITAKLFPCQAILIASLTENLSPVDLYILWRTFSVHFLANCCMFYLTFYTTKVLKYFSSLEIPSFPHS